MLTVYLMILDVENQQEKLSIQTVLIVTIGMVLVV
jgi:hypothetical protein